MNRIILIGNGFDLAHGLKSSYKDFIDDYWNGFIEYCFHQDRLNFSGVYEYDCITLNMRSSRYTMSDLFIEESKKRIFNSPDKQFVSFNEFKKKIDELKKNLIPSPEIQFNVNNQFLLHLLKEFNKETGWVDIENEYYKFLINALNKEINTGYYYKSIDALNDDYNSVKEKLSEYLNNVINTTEILKSEQIQRMIYSSILLRDFTDVGKESIARDEYRKVIRYREGLDDGRNEYLSKKTRDLLPNYENYGEEELKDCILSDLKSDELANKYFDLKPSEILFLNFNYTDTEKHYSLNGDFKIEAIHIHGEIDNAQNPIIFGYGDELEENYRKLENLQDNAYLENIKSVKYLETDNYKQMLNFINSDKYQIVILGHSCGNSDRTLLNTLFEHENCVSIKPYYYQYKDKKSGETKDNYSDIVRNISRNFTDKKSMRDKVVNKTYTDWFSSDINE
jgi:hypothetical protein